MIADPPTSTSTSTPSIASKDGTRVAIHGVGFTADAADRLEEMGYTQEMKRSLGMVSILGLSFAIMAVPFGMSLMFNIGMTDGGPVTMIYGWIFVCCVSLCIAASLGEICSVYPTSGGVYYWSAMLSTPKYQAFASYLTGWLGTVGNWTCACSIAFGGTQMFLAVITVYHPDFVPTPWQTVLTYWAVMLMSFLVNVFGNRYLDKLNTVCLIWTAIGVVTIITCLLVKAPHRNTAQWVFTHYDSSVSGWPKAWAFFVGLLMPAYILTGYGMVASLCEEVRNPQLEVPRAMVLSVAAAMATGLVYLIPLLFVVPLDYGPPIPLMYLMVLRSPGAAFALLVFIMGISFFAIVGSLTAASRCTWAFSRDGGIPFSSTWRVVNKRLDLPLNSLLLSSAICSLLGLIYLGSSAAFNAFTGVATICLGCSYAFPALCNLLRGRKLVRDAPFSLGRFGFVINTVCVVWIAFSIVLFCFPTAIPVSAVSMNYAAVVFAGFSCIAAVWYFVNGRKHYKGPAFAQLAVVNDNVEGGGEVAAKVKG